MVRSSHKVLIGLGGSVRRLPSKGPARSAGHKPQHARLHPEASRPDLCPAPAEHSREAHAEPANKRMDLPGLGRSVSFRVESTPLALQVMRGR